MLDMDHCVTVLVALVCLSSPTISRSYFGPDSYDGKYDYEFDPWHSDPYEIDPNWASTEHPKHSNSNHPTPPHHHHDDHGSWENSDEIEHHHRNGHGNDRAVNHGFQNGHNKHAYSHHHHGGYGHYYGYGNHRNYYNYHQGYDRGYHNNNQNRDHPREAGLSGAPDNSQGITDRNVRPDQNNGIVQPQNGRNDNLGQNGGNNASAAVGPVQGGQNQRSPATDADRLVFPDPTLAFVTRPQNPSSSQRPATPRSPQPPPAATPPSPTALLEMVNCVRGCPVSATYDPVCGSNNFTYNNRGTLDCARSCGVNLTIANRGPCAHNAVAINTEEPEPNLVPFIRRLAITDDTPLPVPTSATQPPTTSAPVPPVTAAPTRSTNINPENFSKAKSTILEVIKRAMNDKLQEMKSAHL